ncbi:hypothetical protein BS50DRAFT_490234 [Corynespora cassiicola Philippines]|uniref:Thioredoxin domain-containing protein n=1 Tax=Corynespora cassiicola Philippines TaxID=1448308 RepID=A0A2T2NT54_CORCC|nr:hypothetical protein BS50DRAFT_490234 [Corynespora cassiicola Philippines]
MNDALGDAIGPREFAALLEEPQVLVAFTSRQYEPVKAFESIFSEAVQELKTPSVIVDCDVESGKELCAEWDVVGWPAVRLFRRRDDRGENEEKEKNEVGTEEEEGDEGADDNTKDVEDKKPDEQKDEDQSSKDDKPTTDHSNIEVIRYRGPRTVPAIRSFLTKYEWPALSGPLDAGALLSFKKVDDIVVVAYLREDHEDTLLATFRTVAEKHHYEFVFAYTTDVEAADAEGLAVPSIVCWKNEDGDHKVLTGKFEEAGVEGVLAKAKVGVIGTFREKEMDKYMVPNKLTTYLFTKNPAHSRALRHALTPVAKKYEKIVTFAVADAVEFRPMAQNFGLKEDLWPAVAVHSPGKDQVFLWRQGKGITVGEMEAMLGKILRGEAKDGEVFGDKAEANKEGKEERGRDEL